MLNYLLVLLVLPVLRRAIVWLLLLMAVGLLVTFPARLWIRYVDPIPSERMVTALNAASVCLLLVFVFRVIYRCRRRGRRARRTG